MTTTMTELITLPLAHAHGIKIYKINCIHTIRSSLKARPKLTAYGREIDKSWFVAVQGCEIADIEQLLRVVLVKVLRHDSSVHVQLPL